MNKILYPPRQEWQNLIKRAQLAQEKLFTLVSSIFEEIRNNGDLTIRKYNMLYDKVSSLEFLIDPVEVENTSHKLPLQLKEAIIVAYNNIKKFHAAQQENILPIETSAGVKCWREHRAIEKVGIYIPGGSAPLFSTVLMLGVPAQLAGCKEVILCTPPDQQGKVHPAILFAAQLVGVTKIFAVGGIQAIGALTFGTESIPKVDKIFGPGNQYVTAAKQAALNYGVAIDMPAGPSEVLVIADDFAQPEFVAADLLSQAEHGADSQVILLSDSEKCIDQTLQELQNQLDTLPRKYIAAAALENSRAILLNNIDECIEFSNAYAPEHLIVAVNNYLNYTEKINNAGSVFLGNYSCESAGDYASGTNHTLPTYGHARSYSGVSLDSFVKKITFQEITQEGIKTIGPIVEIMAEAEELIAHKNAVTVRLKTAK